MWWRGSHTGTLTAAPPPTTAPRPLGEVAGVSVAAGRVGTGRTLGASCPHSAGHRPPPGSWPWPRRVDGGSDGGVRTSTSRRVPITRGESRKATMFVARGSCHTFPKANKRTSRCNDFSGW